MRDQRRASGGRTGASGSIAASLVVVAFVAAGAPACGSSALKEAGTQCASDGECAAGLGCRGLGAFSDAGCSTGASACTRACTLDSDCAPLGAEFKCFAACDGSRACGATR